MFFSIACYRGPGKQSTHLKYYGVRAGYIICYIIWEATGSYRTNPYLVKLQPWFLSLRLKTCLWAELHRWCLSLQWKTCPWAEHSDDHILIFFWRFISLLKYWWAHPNKAAMSRRCLSFIWLFVIISSYLCVYLCLNLGEGLYAVSEWGGDFSRNKSCS